MYYNEVKQKYYVPCNNCDSGRQDQRTLLIRNVSKHPSLYRNEFLRTPYLCRDEKRRMWDNIAEDSGLEKAQDAKVKWRSLITYLRQHLGNVGKKMKRRYIPNTDNPEDKYVQLTDWCFYSELEFIVPYVKYAAKKQGNNKGSSLEISPTEMKVIKEALETAYDNMDNVWTDDDIILKEYFQNMFKSTVRLPKYHQNRIMQQLLDCVNEQMELNKIN